MKQEVERVSKKNSDCRQNETRGGLFLPKQIIKGWTQQGADDYFLNTSTVIRIVAFSGFHQTKIEKHAIMGHQRSD